MAAVALVMSYSLSFASGFGIYEWSGRGNALGGAVIASPKDASAVAFNPASITELDGNHAMVGVSVITPMAEVDLKNYDDATGKTNHWMPPHAYMTNRLNDDWWLGMGIFSRFGLGTEFEEDWAGRYNITEVAIEAMSFNPNLAYKINDKFSIAAGPEIMYLTFLQRKTVDHGLGAGGPFGSKNDPDTYATDTDAKLYGDSIGLGLTLSLFHKPTDWMNVGLVYRSQMKHTIKGDAYFRRQGSQSSPVAGSYTGNHGVEGTLILPDSVSLGVAVKPLDKLTVEGDLIWTRWSTYQEMRIEYDSPLIPGKSYTDHSVSVKNWRDTWRYQLGVEYEALDWLDVRASYIYDQSPIQDDHDDYLLPTNNRQLYSFGLGIRVGDWTIDPSYTYLRSDEREYVNRGVNNAAGVQDGTAHDLETHIVGLSVGYKF